MNIEIVEIKGVNFRLLPLWIAIFFASNTCAQKRTTINQIPKEKLACIELLKEYNEFWTRDSLGDYGFRILMVKEVFKRCDFRNIKWTEVEKYLGKPFAYAKYNDNSAKYKYRLSFFRDNHDAQPGNLFLWVEVKKGIIVYFEILEIDG